MNGLERVSNNLAIGPLTSLAFLYSIGRLVQHRPSFARARPTFGMKDRPTVMFWAFPSASSAAPPGLIIFLTAGVSVLAALS